MANHKKILVVLPCEYDRVESAKLDAKEYKIHFLYPSEDAKDVTTYAYSAYLAEPGFLTSYADRAVDSVKENGITAIMYSHDMASVVASVVCERTGLRGPSLESTFCCLHKYYSRKTENSKLWFDYIHLDDPEKKWKDKVRYPCFLKAPFLMGCTGNSCVRSEGEMERALTKLGELLAPYFPGYSEFFGKYLDLKKYPLAVENIAVVEELVECDEQYCIEGWMDEDGEFHVYLSEEEFFHPKRKETPFAYICPLFSLEKNTVEKLVKETEEIGHRFGLRNTFYDVEWWRKGDNTTVIEVNGRITYALSFLYRVTWGVSVFRAAVYLACGELDKVRKETPHSILHKEGDPICGQFLVYTYGEGKGRDFVNYKYAQVGSIADGSVSYYGTPGMAVFVKEESLVKQMSSSGFYLCCFNLIDHSSQQLLKRAKEIVLKLLLRPEDSLADNLP